MTLRSAGRRPWKKVFQMGIVSLFRSPFNPSKCKTMAKMAVARVKLLRNKREVVIRQMRRDIAMLLESRQDATARIRIEHVIREQNIMAANELIEIFCELVVARLSIIAKQRECPADLKEGISSLIFAAPRCSDIPELLSIRDVFQKKYGKDFVSAATDLRPNAGVNRMLIEKLSVKTPSGEIKMKVLKEIAKEFQVEWDTAESEEELLKPPEERIEGPEKFLSAASMPLKPGQQQYSEPMNLPDKGRTLTLHVLPTLSFSLAALLKYRGEKNSNINSVMNFGELASAAEKALQAAAALAAAASNPSSSSSVINYNNKNNNNNNNNDDDDDDDDERVRRKKMMLRRRQSYDIKFDESDCDEEMEMEEPPKIVRRHSYNNYVAPEKSEENDDDDGMNRPPNRPAPQIPTRRVHPKLPDYDALTARFEALKHGNGHK
ncbi:regulator of Vps4 activity in the MVB pathway protein [Striga asiatica]|uniref:Regulator of Vps4 activity in the MVB pathway protein n=1 Tax=Striga asiatica TaxID=4170 RepID=A0A5A7P9Q3_STRAF|nr:regulator of Vps4 activity in the MVB pathway protein [Striga asiatica]